MKNETPKVGDLLTAIDPCIMEDTKEQRLTVGKKYTVLGVNAHYITINDDQGKSHHFLTESEENWKMFFNLN